MSRLLWLADVARDAGLVVVEIDGWKTRGTADMELKGVINHHTAGAAHGDLPTLAALIKGRPDLAGPLCHYGLGRSGTVYVIASGKANHAGDGQWHGEDFLDSSRSMIGIEAEHTGRASDPWPEEQLEAYRLLDAAILVRIGAPVANLCGHKEWAQPPESTPNRKPDPIGIDMNRSRTDVAEMMRRIEMGDVVVPGAGEGVNAIFATPFDWAVEMGIFTEHTNPDSVVTSEEFAAFLDRYHQRVVVPNLRSAPR
ncbi:MAG: N-acetylmuramoyl-L-alanine amidase [Acidimicrobiia bacterium]|nr:N-acetylmuramoyl-L-alanine amidase [Acidimicrobiia bacterium]